MKIASDILELVGNTPLVYLNKLTKNSKARIAVKLEAQNPIGCVKERIGKAMIDDALAAGTIKEGMTIIEPTSGNTGIALAATCSVRGLKCILTMPESMSMERRQIMRLFGAELVLTPAAEGMKGAIAKADELHKETPNSWVPSQFENPSNPKIHQETTANEIWNDTDGTVDILVSGVGTGGTLTGCAQTLKSKNADIQIVAVEPTDSAILSGGAPGPHKIQGIGAGFVPGVLQTDIIDSIEQVGNDEAGEAARQAALQEGIFCGISGGAALTAAIRLAEKEENAGKLIVAVLPDTGERYLSTWLFEDYAF